MTNLIREIIKVHVRQNTGENVYLEMFTMLDALDQAKRERNVTNYMVCIEIDNERTHRWDREFAVNVNRWRKREPDARELMGKLPTIYQVQSLFTIPTAKNDAVAGLKQMR